MSARSFRRSHRRRLAAARRRDALKARRAGLAATAAIGATAVMAPSAEAANIPVSNTADALAPPAGSLRAAITTANSNGQPDTITFNSGVTGTIHLAGQLPVTAADSLTISGPGRDVLALSGDSDSNGTPDTRIFNVGNGGPTVGPLTISGLTLTKGTTAAGSPANFGGALYGYVNTDVTITDSAISGNTAPGGSGDGGGIYTRGDLAIAGTNLSGNSAGNLGGAVQTTGNNGSTTTISNSTISGNTAGGGGGIFNGGPLTMTGSTVSGNVASNRGGGIQQAGSKYPVLNISDSTISGNSAANGGGISAADAKYAPSHINRTTISGNTASGYGAGIYFSGLATGDRFTITHSTLSGNNGGPASFGGGISFAGTINGEFELVDSTISGNTAATGGGVSIGEAVGPQTLGPNGSLAFNNSTVASNNASSKAGGMYLGQYNNGSGNTSATITVVSTIVADNNAAGSGQDLDRADTSTGGGFDTAFSLIEAPGDAPLLASGATLLGQDPQLAALADNGGPTQTELPAQTSPVIDQGDSAATLKTDQRGEPRRVDRDKPNASDGTDIGSVELSPDTTPPDTLIKKKPKKKIKTPKKKIKVKVTFSSSEAGSTFQCKLDKGRFKTCASPFKPKASSKFGKGKKHTIQIRAIDAAGNVDPSPAKVGFRVIRVHRGR